MPVEIMGWYIVEVENNPFLCGTFEFITKSSIIEPITRISCFKTDEYYIIETEEDSYKCLFSEENSSRHCEKATSYLQEAKERGMCFIYRLSPAHFYNEEIELIANSIFNELSPEIIKDIRQMPKIDSATEDAIKQFIRVTALDYPEGAIPFGTDGLIYEHLIQLIKK